MIAEPDRETGDLRKVEMETSRVIKKITLEQINLKIDYIKISQNQNTDKAVDVTVVTEEIVTQMQHDSQKDSEKEIQWGFELDLRHSERAS